MVRDGNHNPLPRPPPVQCSGLLPGRWPKRVHLIFGGRAAEGKQRDNEAPGNKKPSEERELGLGL